MKNTLAGEKMNHLKTLIRSTAGNSSSVRPKPESPSPGRPARLRPLRSQRAGERRERQRRLVRLPSFAVPEAVQQMAIATGADRISSINLALKALGGIETFVKPGDRVLIKVNAVIASPPFLCATTNPELLAEVARLCFKAGASSVRVTDNPINNPESCFALTGIGEAARSAGAELVLPRDAFFKPTTVPGGTLIKNWPVLYAPFEGVNKLIGIAPVKDHHRSGATMSMKNWYGLIGGRRKSFTRTSTISSRNWG